MSDWRTTPLGELADTRKGAKVDVFDERRADTTPYLGAGSLDTGLSRQWASTRGAILADRTDVLMLWDGERSGLTGGGLEGVVASTVARVRPRPIVDPAYLRHALQARFSWIQSQRTGTGVPHVPKDIGKRLFISHPTSVAEQRAVAEILDTLDGQIRLTESVASKLRATFIGLLTHLLTQGLQSTTPPGDATLEFGQTSITLPKRWTIEPVGHLLGAVDPAMRSGPFGSALLKHELVDSGVPLLGIDNVHIDRFVADFQRFVTPAKAAELSRYRVRPGDVMITIMGTVGRSCLVPEDIGHALSSKHVWTMSFDDARYRPYLASLQLNHAPWARAHLRRDEQGGIMSAIRSDTLKTLMLPVPPIDEQLEIETVLRTVEWKIASYDRLLSKLRALKAGLADDLLTGRVRVPTGGTS